MINWVHLSRSWSSGNGIWTPKRGRQPKSVERVISSHRLISLLSASSFARTSAIASEPSRRCTGGSCIDTRSSNTCAARLGSPFCLPLFVSRAVRIGSIAGCRRAGFEPLLGQVAPEITSVGNLVAAGFGVSIVPVSIAQVRVAAIEYVAISGEPLLARLALATRQNDRSTMVANFVALATKFRRRP
jgi:DNA-binding transcriptional LysR family regulator